MKDRPRAFTLIELLVVTAILFPVFAQAKTAAKKSVDMSNMKQMCLADDEDPHFPPWLEGCERGRRSHRLPGLQRRIRRLRPPPLLEPDRLPLREGWDIFKSPGQPNVNVLE